MTEEIGRKWDTVIRERIRRYDKGEARTRFRRGGFLRLGPKTQAMRLEFLEWAEEELAEAIRFMLKRSHLGAVVYTRSG